MASMLRVSQISGLAVERGSESRAASASRSARPLLPCRATARSEASAARAAVQLSLPALAALVGVPAATAAQGDFVFDGYAGASTSFWTVLGLFVMSVPGLWSIIKRSTKVAPKRRVYEVPGPSQPGAQTMDAWAKRIATYFIKYNYSIVGTGEVIVFEGTYQASKSQAFALTAYTAVSLWAVALVLQTLFPEVGNWWYAMCLVSPLAGSYYLSRGTRNEQCRVKMVAADDESTVDIIVEGDQEELDRFAEELSLMEKGKVRVKGLLEAS